MPNIAATPCHSEKVFLGLCRGANLNNMGFEEMMSTAFHFDCINQNSVSSGFTRIPVASPIKLFTSVIYELL